MTATTKHKFPDLTYTVETLREAGLEAKWSKTSRGRPILVARWPAAKSRHQRESWWAVDAQMFESMKRSGVIDGFDGATMLGDLFSFPI